MSPSIGINRVAVYCRVSSDKEEQLKSYDNQVSYYTEYNKKNSEWTYMVIYSDEWISGTSTKKRDDFIRMIEDAKAGKIDLILTKSISRFGRNVVVTLRYTRDLKEKGVVLKRRKLTLLKQVGTYDDNI